MGGADGPVVLETAPVKLDRSMCGGLNRPGIPVSVAFHPSWSVGPELFERTALQAGGKGGAHM